jgi:hypothetical protein
MKSPVDKVGQAPRATPCGLARLPKIYLQERYQIHQVLKPIGNLWYITDIFNAPHNRLAKPRSCVASYS